MENDKINEAGKSVNTDSLKNMDEQSGRPSDGSQVYLDTDSAAQESAHGDADKKEKKEHHRSK